MGLAYYAGVSIDETAAAPRNAPLSCCSNNDCSARDPLAGPIHPSWTVLHNPAYWHYDVMQGLRLLADVDRLTDPPAADALDVIQAASRPGGFASRRWSTNRQPAAVEWGRGTHNPLLTR